MGGNGFPPVLAFGTGVGAGWLTGEMLGKKNTYLTAASIVVTIFAFLPSLANLYIWTRQAKTSGKEQLRSIPHMEAVCGGVLSGLVFNLATIKHMFVGFFILYNLAVKVL